MSCSSTSSKADEQILTFNFVKELLINSVRPEPFDSPFGLGLSKDEQPKTMIPQDRRSWFDGLTTNGEN